MCGDVGAGFGERGQESGGGLFAGFDAGLVVGVDVDQAGVEGHGAFERGDEGAEVEGIDPRDAERHAFAAVFGERLAGAAEEALEEIAAGGAGLDLDRVAGAVLADLDEGDEEVVHAVAQLLDIGVLVGGALVAVDGDALVDLVAVEVEFLAEGFHDELLEVFGEQEQAVLVGQDDHVLERRAAAGVVPHEGERAWTGCGGGSGWRVLSSMARAPARKASMSTPWRAAGTRPTTLMTEVRPPTQSDMGNRLSQPWAAASLSSFEPGPVTATAWCGNEAGAGEGGFGVEHAVAGFRGAAGLGDDDGERGGEFRADVGEDALHAVGIGVVEEGDGHRRAGPASASATNCGPRAEPPMPMTRTRVNLRPSGGATAPAWTSAAKA